MGLFIYNSPVSSNYPQMSREDAIKHCRYWASQIQKEGIESLASDYGSAIGISDQLVYPLDQQNWITPEDEPILHAINMYAIDVDSDHTNREAWQKIVKLSEIL